MNLRMTLTLRTDWCTSGMSFSLLHPFCQILYFVSRCYTLPPAACLCKPACVYVCGSHLFCLRSTSYTSNNSSYNRYYYILLSGKWWVINVEDCCTLSDGKGNNNILTINTYGHTHSRYTGYSASQPRRIVGPSFSVLISCRSQHTINSQVTRLLKS